MTKNDFMTNRPFVVRNIPGYDWVYTESMFGGEVRISNGRHTQTIEVEEINIHYFVIECWLNRHTDGRIFFKDCEVK